MARRLTKRDLKFSLRRMLYVLIPLGGAVLFIIGFLWIGRPSVETKGAIKAGVTFSIPYAKDLGLNWREALRGMLDDLGIRNFRIPVYWNAVEPDRGEYDWSEIDYQMKEISMRNGSVILAVGAKLPRWPECWIPEWALHQSVREERETRLAYIKATVERYKDNPALAAWQVENEALFPFGVCPKPNRGFLKQEIELVRRLDISHPITTTDSGELSTWLRTGSLADRLGVSTYRVVLTFWGAPWKYTWIPPYWYARHAALLKPFTKDVYVSEFQMEPWTEDSLTITPLRKQFETFSIDQMRENFTYAEHMRINEIYFWGAEWWWWMKVKQHDDRYWETAKEFFQKHRNE
jgi:GH35 family endo-1,4-beta-xylanase